MHSSAAVSAVVKHGTIVYQVSFLKNRNNALFRLAFGTNFRGGGERAAFSTAGAAVRFKDTVAVATTSDS